MHSVHSDTCCCARGCPPPRRNRPEITPSILPMRQGAKLHQRVARRRTQQLENGHQHANASESPLLGMEGLVTLLGKGPGGRPADTHKNQTPSHNQLQHKNLQQIARAGWDRLAAHPPDWSWNTASPSANLQGHNLRSTCPLRSRSLPSQG